MCSPKWERLYVNVVKQHSVPVGPDDTGQLSDAFIELKGNTIEGKICRNSREERLCTVQFKRGYVDGRADSFFPDYDFNVDAEDKIVHIDEFIFPGIHGSCINVNVGWQDIFLVLRRGEDKRGIEGCLEDSI